MSATWSSGSRIRWPSGRSATTRRSPVARSTRPPHRSSRSRFGRVEDIDYRKSGAGREIYFTVTGQNNTGVNASSDRTKYGRVYRLKLDARDPLKGTLEVILDGDDRSGPAGLFQNPDNIFVGENYVYVQEDDNGYGDEAHDALHLPVQHRDQGAAPGAFSSITGAAQPDAAIYNAVGGRPEGKAGWEYGAMIDVSNELGQQGHLPHLAAAALMARREVCRCRRWDGPPHGKPGEHAGIGERIAALMLPHDSRRVAARSAATLRVIAHSSHSLPSSWSVVMRGQ